MESITDKKFCPWLKPLFELPFKKYEWLMMVLMASTSPPPAPARLPSRSLCLLLGRKTWIIRLTTHTLPSLLSTHSDVCVLRVTEYVASRHPRGEQPAMVRQHFFKTFCNMKFEVDTTLTSDPIQVAYLLTLLSPSLPPSLPLNLHQSLT